eukprot:COSAG01_NODE_14933_length_1394_cov_1.044015_1_plen_58_part_10
MERLFLPRNVETPRTLWLRFTYVTGGRGGYDQLITVASRDSWFLHRTAAADGIDQEIL